MGRSVLSPCSRRGEVTLVDVPTPQKAFALLASLLLPLTAGAQTAPPPSSAGVFPLSQVHAGLHGTAWTVFQGSTPEPFGVDILGVLRKAQGPGEDLILARLTGAKAEYTGVVAGMSGSPVYIDGKLVGALAYRIGEFSKEPIAGITPIEQMLPVRDGDARSNTRPSSPTPGTPNQIKPIETPLVFSGFSPEALALWKEHAPALGLEPVAGLGSGQGDTTPLRQPLEPGSAISALLVSGDLEIAATCTVTYLDGGHLLACGHPLTQFGAISLPMTEADVVATLPSASNSFKIVNTGAVVGAWTQDRQTAIGGLIGALAHTIPVEIGLQREGAPSRSVHLQVLDQAQTTPTALLVSLFQVLQQNPGYGDEDSYRVHATVRLAGSYPPVEIDTLAAPGAGGSAALPAALNVALRFNSLYSSTERQVAIAGVKVDVAVMPGRRSITLNRAAVEQTQVHAGEHITIAATLNPYRGDARQLRIPVTLPPSLPDGEVRLLVSDGPALDRALAAGRAAGNTPLSGTVAQLNSLHADDRIYVTLLTPDVELNVEGQTLATLPLSVANLLTPAHERDRASLHSESPQPLGSVALDASFSGEQILTLRVE